MPAIDFSTEFATLKSILKKYEKRCLVDRDSAEEYFLNFKPKDAKSKPVFFAGTGINKITLSFYLSAVDRYPDLREAISPELRRHSHGKCCFRFKQSDPSLFKELTALTKQAFARYGSEA